MSDFDPSVLKNLYKPASDSHKGENGKLLIVGGSQLFHAASLWALTVASRIVDMVFYSSVESNNKIVEGLKSEFRNGIVIPRSKIDNYAKEADVILIGPGLPREEGLEEGDDDTKELTQTLFAKFPNKKWVVDGGSLQVIEPEILPKTSILTPHKKEFSKLFKNVIPGPDPESLPAGQAGQEILNQVQDDNVQELAKKYVIVILLKGEQDIVSSPEETVRIPGGNAGMTKGGTGDVLAGLVAALYTKNDAFLSAVSASYINKKAGESLEKKMGIYFNASDLASEIPQVMKELL